MYQDILARAFSGNYYHSAYDETVALADQVAVHAEGLYPEAMMEERRPNESSAVQTYRKTIFKAITKPYINKVFISLNKIRRSTEWSINFKQSHVPPRIVEKETLENYLMKYFPQFTSITNWTFDLLLKRYCIDPNSVIVVMPFKKVLEQTEYVKPYPFLYRADQVIEQTDEAVVILDDEKTVFTENKHEYFGDIYIVITATSIEKWHQTSTTRDFAKREEYLHNIGYLPAFKLRAVVKRIEGDVVINESRLAPMLPELDEAIREYSDLQAEVVQHIYSEKWEYAGDDQECLSCKGKGKMPGAGFRGNEVNCGDCGGSGVRARGPFSTMYVKKPMAGDAPTPTPPMGYVIKDTAIVELQDKRVDKHIFKALASVNMEFLAERPLAESGISKAYDADETNNFVHSVAEDLVAIMDEVCFFINEMRYSVLIPDFATRQQMLPVINVPERFDLFSAKLIEEQLKSARDSKVSPVIINALETEYAKKMFSANPDVGKRVELIISLDPLSGVSEEDKMVMKSNKGISDVNYVISSSISAFIDRAVEEHGDAFYQMTTADQRALLVAYAKEQISETSAAATIISNFNEGLQSADQGDSGEDIQVQ